MTEISIKFWKRLLELIKLEGLSLKKFTDNAGLPYSTINSALQRGSVPSPEILSKIAGYFGVSIDSLLTGESTWQDGVYMDGRKIAETSADADLYRQIDAAEEATRARVKAILEADRKMLEERKRREALKDIGELGPHTRKRKGRK